MAASSPVRNSMTQTATVRRTLPGPLNPTGQPTPGTVEVHELACRAWEATESTIADDGRRFAVSVIKMRAPLDADIKRDDNVTIRPTGDTRNVFVGDVDTVIVRRGHQLVTIEDYLATQIDTLGGFSAGFSAGFDVVRDA